MKIYTNEEIKKRKEKEQNRLKIIRRICIPITTIIIIFCLFITYKKVIKKESKIEILGFQAYMILTGSMQPNYNMGDVVIIKKTPINEIKAGDVITYQLDNNSATVTHRVEKIINKEDKIFFITKGDNNNAPDPEEIDYSNVQGVVQFKISKVGKIITELLTGSGFIVLILLTVISFAHSNHREDIRIEREEARAIHNVCKYKKEEEETKEQIKK